MIWIWVVSLILLIACFIFAYRMIVSSYDFLPADKKFSLGFNKTSSPSDAHINREVVDSLRSKLKSVEDISSFYEVQFSKLQQRIKVLEEIHHNSPAALAILPHIDEEEDWKEMYYEENDAKSKIENELDEVQQQLAEVLPRIKSFEENAQEWGTLKSDHDARLKDLEFMQNSLGTLQRQLEAAADREKGLEKLLLAEIEQKKQYVHIERENTRIISENDELRRQVVAINRKEAALDEKMQRVNELESKVALYEEEKARMIADLEQMVSQNKS